MFPITAKSTGTTVLPNVKLPLSTTVSTVPPYRRLTAAKAITATVRQNARPLTATTAGTERRLFPPVRRTRPVLTSPTALPKSVPGPANPGINKKEARALKMTPVTTERQLFQAVRAMQAVLITPIVPPKSAPGLVTLDTES